MSTPSRLHGRGPLGSRTNHPSLPAEGTEFSGTSESIGSSGLHRGCGAKRLPVDKSDDIVFAAGYLLKFGRRIRDNYPVLTKWSNGERATWGEKGGTKYSYESGEIIFGSYLTWKWLYRLYQNHGLPLDPDPIATIDILFSLADPPTENEYRHGFLVRQIDPVAKKVTVVPVVRVPFDAMFLPDEKPTADGVKKPEYKWLMLGSAKEIWDEKKLNLVLNQTLMARSLHGTGKMIEFTMQATVGALDLATGPVKAAVAKALKSVLKERLKNFGKVIHAFGKLDGPLGKALLAMAKTLAIELAKDKALQNHFELQKKSKVLSIVVYKKDNPSFAKAMQLSTGQFATTFASEFLTELFAAKVAKDEFLRRRVKYTLSGDVTEDLITAPFRKAIQEWGHKFFIIDRVSDVINVINNAMTASMNSQELQLNLEKELKSVFSSAIKENIATALKTLAL